MRNPLQFRPAGRVLFPLLFAALSLLAGCQKVRGLFARLDPHSVTIGWTASSSPVAGYNVYRETQFSGPIKLTPKMVTGTEYIDKNVESGRTYSYFVTSVDSRGLESKPSEKISATVPK
ncbi:MAG TPA: fibronectin type III domain-containing protein [Candidatus Acidoferrales bacterium]